MYLITVLQKRNFENSRKRGGVTGKTVDVSNGPGFKSDSI